MVDIRADFVLGMTILEDSVDQLLESLPDGLFQTGRGLDVLPGESEETALDAELLVLRLYWSPYAVEL